MGLDMYLMGRTFHPLSESSKDIDLGYWRKHPNLHGYIVMQYADGKDECQEIPLTKENLFDIMDAIKFKRLPFTSGFFFGRSDESSDRDSLKCFEAAISFLDQKRSGESRIVFYQASW